MIESHIGAVAANIPLMGPLITLLAKQLRHLATTPFSVRGEPEKQGSSKHVLGSHRRVDHEFKRMYDDGSGGETLVGMASPIIGKGASEMDEEILSMDQLGKHRIRVQTDLEQDYGSPMPLRGAIF